MAAFLLLQAHLIFPVDCQRPIPGTGSAKPKMFQTLQAGLALGIVLAREQEDSSLAQVMQGLLAVGICTVTDHDATTPSRVGNLGDLGGQKQLADICLNMLSDYLDARGRN